MFALQTNHFAYALAVVATLAFASSADAGWVTIKNDTNKAVVVQEVVVVNGKQMRGKPTKLLAGESFREFQNTSGEKTYEVLEAVVPNGSLWRGSLNCKLDSQTFSITNQGRVAVKQVSESKKKP